ncbi:hypothetical protein CPC08DRAFT_823807 [Agrocybe pediades]|nr:hypothetical protein CPC08DRAFT_823807 [Agrocybe pediades]
MSLSRFRSLSKNLYHRRYTVATYSIRSLGTAVKATPSLLLKTTGPDAVNTVADLRVVTTLTNTGNNTLKLLHHPLTGVLVKYIPMASGDERSYTVLGPDHAISLEHNLGQKYDFTNSAEGEYDISPSREFWVLNADSSISSFEAQTSESYSVKVSGALTAPRFPIRGIPCQ